MKTLNIQKTTFKMPSYKDPWDNVLLDMLTIYNNRKYHLNRYFCNKLLEENAYSAWTATINGEYVTVIQANGFIPVQTVNASL